MDNDHYIDILRVNLSLPFVSAPDKAKDEADRLTDEHVVPAVESVMEAAGREFEANIPFLEIDVGYVRSQDLRDAVETALRNALEKYRTPLESSFSSALGISREYMETGIVPWENGQAVYNPLQFISEAFQKNPEALWSSVGELSKRELANMLLIAGPIAASGEEAAAPVSSSRILLHRLREIVLARLTREFPETATVLTGRLMLWRAYRCSVRPLSEGGREMADSFGDSATNVLLPDTGALNATGKEPGNEGEYAPWRSNNEFKYIEVALADIPDGRHVVETDFVEHPDEQAPEYVRIKSTPSKYFRKIAGSLLGEQRVTMLAGTETETETDANAEIRVVPVRPVKDWTGHLQGPLNLGSTIVSASGSTGSPAIYRYVEVSLSDIPEGSSVEAKEYTENPVRDDPAFILVIGTPPRYYKKVEAGPDMMERELVEKDSTEAIRESTEMKDDEPILKERSYSYRYIEVALSDIPEGSSVEAKEYTENPVRDDPEFILVLGTPLRYYRKVSAEKDAVEKVEVKKGTEESEPVKKARGDAAGDMPAINGRTMLRPGAAAVASWENEIHEGQGEVWGIKDAVATEREKVPALTEHWNGEISLVQELGLEDDLGIWRVQDFEFERIDTRIPVLDAGLVLLHPFLGRLMEHLGLVKKGRFVSPLAQMRAVHLMRDLTKAEEPHYNHTLVLEKILCGLPVGYAVPLEWEPSEKEKQETESLLEAVCEYWKPLSGSSTEALCGSFIRRLGMVERFEDSWIIRVEGHAIDILLDDLPWELSIIHLPWLKSTLAVEWQHE